MFEHKNYYCREGREQASDAGWNKQIEKLFKKVGKKIL
jgi:hypothetical protein